MDIYLIKFNNYVLVILNLFLFYDFYIMFYFKPQGFNHKYVFRNPVTKEPNVEFDVTLLEETENLQANEILWNNLTADSLQAVWVSPPIKTEKSATLPPSLMSALEFRADCGEHL